VVAQVKVAELASIPLNTAGVSFLKPLLLRGNLMAVYTVLPLIEPEVFPLKSEYTRS